MPGQNPYIAGEVKPPVKKYKLTIIDEQKKEHTLEIDPAKVPYEDHGLPGSILDVCMAHGIELDHACGGVCACSTCHVIVRKGGQTCNAASEEEEDQLDEAYGLTAQSRLGCQCVPSGEADVVVEIPSWNRNLAREPHGPQE
ncbi:2Fe-2S ferredoxin [Phycisphaerae bacterium RAS1]|nr:2Fe-2S ferredoxin [Phycisphaerae bacterium RAS1]